MKGSIIDVIHFLPHIRNSGNGITNAVVDLAVSQSKSGMSVVVCSAGGDYRAQLTANGVSFIDIDMTSWRRPRSFLSALWKLRAIARSNRFTTFHCHSLITLLLVYLSGATRRVVTVHNSWQRFTFVNLFLAQRVIVLSELDKVRFSRFAVLRRRVYRVENGVVDSVRFHEKCPPVELRRPAIVTVAGLYSRKGIGDVLTALTRMDEEAFLYVVGEGPQRAELESMAVDLGVEQRVVFVGFSPMAHSYMSSCDVFTLASHNEPAGLVLVEARMLGAAVVATDVGGIPSMLKPNAGLLVPARDPSALAAAFDRLVSDFEELSLLRHRSLEGLEYYSVHRVAADVARVYGTFDS